jgi:hypothetical protein
VTSLITDLTALLPAWLPQWASLGLLVVGALWAIAFLALPFTAFSLRGRLDAIEARMDELQAEIRGMSLHLPGAAVWGSDAEDLGERLRPPPREAPPAPDARVLRPPIPPAPDDVAWDGGRTRLGAERGLPRPLSRDQTRPMRDEPRLNWPE